MGIPLNRSSRFLLICSIVGMLFALSSPDMLRAEHPIPAIQDSETQAQRDARMGWWRDTRFGMFIHWGLYAVPAGPWNGKPVPDIGERIMRNASIPVHEYERLAPQFDLEVEALA